MAWAQASFIGCFLFEVPSNIILHKVGARVWIARVMVSWALVSAAIAFVHPPTVFYVWFAKDLATAEIALTVATTGVLVTLTQFWCLPTSVLASTAAASGIAVVNSVGNLAGFVSPYAVGWIIDATHSTTLGVHTLAGCLPAGSLLAPTMPRRLVNR